jgi:hypothetical protein
MKKRMYTRQLKSSMKKRNNRIRKTKCNKRKTTRKIGGHMRDYGPNGEYRGSPSPQISQPVATKPSISSFAPKTSGVLGKAASTIGSAAASGVQTTANSVYNLSKIWDTISIIGTVIPNAILQTIFVSLKIPLDIYKSTLQTIGKFFVEENKTLQGIYDTGKAAIKNTYEYNKLLKEYTNFINKSVLTHNKYAKRISENMQKAISIQKKSLDDMLIGIGCQKTLANQIIRSSKNRSRCMNTSNNQLNRDTKQNLKDNIIYCYKQLAITNETKRSSLQRYSNDIIQLGIDIKGADFGNKDNEELYKLSNNYVKKVEEIIKKMKNCDPYLENSVSNMFYNKITNYITDLNKLDQKKLNAREKEIKQVRLIAEKQQEEQTKINGVESPPNEVQSSNEPVTTPIEPVTNPNEPVNND